jgi:hypothetical protein
MDFSFYADLPAFDSSCRAIIICKRVDFVSSKSTQAEVPLMDYFQPSVFPLGEHWRPSCCIVLAFPTDNWLNRGKSPNFQHSLNFTRPPESTIMCHDISFAASITRIHE